MREERSGVADRSGRYVPISSLCLWLAAQPHGKFSRRLGWQSICSIAVAALSPVGHYEGLAAARIRSEELAITSPLDGSNGSRGMGALWPTWMAPAAQRRFRSASSTTPA